jgi:hypothetical protein
MKIQSNKVFLTLILSAVCSSIFGESELSKLDGKGTLVPATFVKRVKAGGALISTIQAADGGYVSLSQTGQWNFLVRKISTSGQTIWERRVDSREGTGATLEAIAQTTDGGYVLAGQNSYCCFGDYFYYNTSHYAGLLIKLRSNGTLEWSKKFELNSHIVHFTSVVPRPDGGFIAGGGGALPGGVIPILVRFSANGNILSSKTFGNLLADNPQLKRTPDNNLLLAVSSENGASVIKVNDSGVVVWEKSLEIPGFILQTMGSTSDNGVVLAGNCTDCNQLYLVRIKADGKLGWKAKYSFQVGRLQSVTDLIQTSDGGYAVTGTITDSKGHNAIGFFAKIDSLRNVSSQRTFRVGQARGGSIFAASDGTYFLFAATNGEWSGDTLVLKLDTNGVVPGCAFVHSSSVTRVAFGELKTSRIKVSSPINPELGTSDFVANSKLSHHAVTNVCK